MKKNNVWKQALALALSATLVLGNSAFVSAADEDAEIDMSKYEALEFTGDGVMSNDGYTEKGITFSNVGVEIVDAPVITPGDGVSGSNGGDDGGHGKVFKFSNGITDPEQIATATGTTYLTSVAGSLEKYDYSIGATFSFDIYPEQQSDDWNYLFGIGVFSDPKHAMVGTVGFSAGFDSEEKRLADGESWQAFTPNTGWINGSPDGYLGYTWDYFKLAANTHKWYNIKYTYTIDGMTIAVNDVPIVTYRDTKGYMENILKSLNKGSLRFGKGVVPDYQGYVGLMDNMKIEPLAPHKHVYEEENPEGQILTEPTCTEVGTKRMPKCTICHVMPTEVAPALGHTFEGAELVPEKAASCTRTGQMAHYECTREDCTDGYAIADTTAEGGKKEVAASELQIKALGHEYDTTVTKAKDGVDGAIVQTCKRENCSGGSNATKTTVIPKAEIALEKASYAYTGKAIEPKVTITADGKALSADNYKITYSNNVNPGNGTVTIEFKGDNYEGTATRTFKIEQNASLTLDKSSVTLYTGDASKTATVSVKAITGASKTVTWKSDNDKIAKVDANGKITAVKAGTTTVTATANGVTQKVAVTVKNPTITLKSGKKNFTKKAVTVKKKKKVTYTVSVNPAKSGMKLAKLSKKDAKIAKVTLSKKGKLVIQGKKKGSLKIKITSGKATKTLTIKVK